MWWNYFTLLFFCFFIFCVWVFSWVYACASGVFLVALVAKRGCQIPWTGLTGYCAGKTTVALSKSSKCWAFAPGPRFFFLVGNDALSFGWWAFVMRSDKPGPFLFGYNIPICCIWLEGWTGLGFYSQEMTCGRHGRGGDKGLGYFPQTSFSLGIFSWLEIGRDTLFLSLCKAENSEQWAIAPLSAKILTLSSTHIFCALTPHYQRLFWVFQGS